MGLKIGTLREIGAKKGDVVAFHEDGEYKFTIGWLNESSAYGTAQHCGREFSDNWSLTATKTWRIVSPAEPTGPVRTVTRTTREIVPGIYNRLGVGEQSGDCIWVGLVENDGDYDLGSLLNASQLRALAATLTEIADALEEQ